MPPPPCQYCERIRAADPRYRARRAAHDLVSEFPRCDFHWRFACAVCGNARIFHAIAHCPRRDALFCVECAKGERTVRGRFWAWSYHYALGCPWHRGSHAALDRLEYEGRHPWQIRPVRRRARWGLTKSEEVPDRWSFRVGPAAGVTDRALRASWDAVAGWWVRRYTEKGDLNREWVIDPVLLAFLGVVKGRRVLDAGCGNGYLSRILARRGARVVGVDSSPQLLREAIDAQAGAPLPIEYVEGDLADLSSFAGGSFDLAVSNVVLQDVRRLPKVVGEIFRVLRPGGRFVFSITHPAFESPPSRWVRIPKDTERPEERVYLAVDRYFDFVASYWAPAGLPEVVGFHRPLRDYTAALSATGFVIERLEEPTPRAEAIRSRYRQFADQLRVPNFLVIEARRPPVRAARPRPRSAFPMSRPEV